MFVQSTKRAWPVVSKNQKVKYAFAFACIHTFHVHVHKLKPMCNVDSNEIFTSPLIKNKYPNYWDLNQSSVFIMFCTLLIIMNKLKNKNYSRLYIFIYDMNLIIIYVEEKELLLSFSRLFTCWKGIFGHLTKLWF